MCTAGRGRGERGELRPVGMSVSVSVSVPGSLMLRVSASTSGWMEGRCGAGLDRLCERESAASGRVARGLLMLRVSGLGCLRGDGGTGIVF